MKWCKKQRENKNMAQTKEPYIILIYNLLTYNTSILQEHDADKPNYTCCMNTQIVYRLCKEGITEFLVYFVLEARIYKAVVLYLGKTYKVITNQQHVC